MELAERIVADFHSMPDAKQAHEDFNREVRQGAEPSDIETVVLPDEARAANGFHVHRMLVGVGFASSRTEAERLEKSGAVEIDGQRWAGWAHPAMTGTITVRVGKRWKRVRLS